MLRARGFCNVPEHFNIVKKFPVLFGTFGLYILETGRHTESVGLLLGMHTYLWAYYHESTLL